MIRLGPAIRFRDDPRATRRIDDEPARGRLAASILLVLDHGTLRIIHGSPKACPERSPFDKLGASGRRGLRYSRRGDRQSLPGYSCPDTDVRSGSAGL